MPTEVWSSYLHSLWWVERRRSRTWQQVLEFYGSLCKEWRTLSKEILKVPHQPCIYLICNTSAQFHRHMGQYAWKFLLKILFYEREKSTLSLFRTPSKSHPKDILIASIGLKIPLLVVMSSMKSTNLHQQHAKSLSCTLGKSWYPFNLLHCSKRPIRWLHQ